MTTASKGRRATRDDGRRAGRTLLEVALVLNLLIVLMMGVFEYGRLIMVRQLAANAAREGARIAVVSTNSSSGVTTAQIQSTVTNFLASQTLNNLVVQVYAADSITGNSIGDWTTAPFGSNIAVQVDFDFVPIVPIYSGLPAALHVRAKSIMRCEAN